VNEQTDSQLLRNYAGHRSEAAFSELVRRHLDLVYSVALRMVRDSHLAEDVTQGVFLALARNASQLSGRLVLSSWLHRTAQNIAAQTVRTIERRRAREQEAAAMNQLLAAESDAPWEHIAPHLDAALGELTEPDRDAVMLRYFERKSARQMAFTLGISEDAAQKRVSRAVERLREHFARQGIAVGASGLVLALSAHAVQAAPVGLAVTISTAAALGGTTIASAATATATKAIAMTTLQKTIVTATVAVLAGVGIYEARQAAKVREQNQALQQQQTSLTEQIQQSQRERDDASNRLAALAEENAALKRNPTEVLKLRGQVGSLRSQLQSATNVARRTPGAGETANMFNNPAMRKSLAQARLVAARTMYAPLLREMKLKPEEADKFINLLGDNSLKIQDQSTAALRGETPKDAATQIIKNLKNELDSELQALLGPERYAQYQQFNANQQESKLNQSIVRTLDSLAKAPPNNSLGEDQRQRLARLLRDNQLGAVQTAPSEEMPISSEEIEQRFQRQAERDQNTLREAGSFLTSQQLAALASVQANQISEQKERLALMLQMIGASGQGRTAASNQGN